MQSGIRSGVRNLFDAFNVIFSTFLFFPLCKPVYLRLPGLPSLLFRSKLVMTFRRINRSH